MTYLRLLVAVLAASLLLTAAAIPASAADSSPTAKAAVSKKKLNRDLRKVRIRTTAAELAEEVGVDRAIADEVIARLRRMRLLTEEPHGLIVADVGRVRDFLEFLEMPNKFGGES